MMIDERNEERDCRNRETVKISRSRLDDNGVFERQCTRSLILFKHYEAIEFNLQLANE